MFEVFADIISEMAVSMLKLYLNQFSIDLIFLNYESRDFPNFLSEFNQGPLITDGRKSNEKFIFPIHLW